MNDGDLESLFKESLKELSDDPCFPLAQQRKWHEHRFSPNPSLFSSFQKILKKLKDQINAEEFYGDYNGQISATLMPFPGLDRPSSVELLRKIGVKILARFQKAVCHAGEDVEEDIPIMQKDEIDALEYLGGYIIPNLDRNIKRKSNSSEYLEILRCFESHDVKDQPLIKLLDRGGLRGITENAKNIFTKAEHKFRRCTAGNLQKVDINEIAKDLMKDFDVTGDFFTATDHIADLKEEILLIVVEGMLLVYLRVRAFSCVRDIAMKKKKEKDALLREKSLRKTLKNNKKTDE